MKEKTKEDLLLALAAGMVTFIVTYATMRYINPSIREWIK